MCLDFFQRTYRVSSLNGNEDQGQSSTANDSEIGAVAKIDTDMAKDTAERELIIIEEEQSDTFSGNEADTKPSGQSSDAPKEPQIYFDWLDEKTLVKIFGEFEAIYRKTTSE